jgi:uncharacterized cysteine cluster protein YcgN (CxxCxxCC family)
MSKTCDECTECCTGTLAGEAYGHKFDETTACFFLENNKCSIYATRPDNPCKNYSCMWLNDDGMPDFMRPDKSNVVLTQKSFDNVFYIHAKEAARKSMTTTVLSNLIMYALHTQQNLVYYVSGQCYWYGDPEFTKIMARRSKDIQIKAI